MLNPASVCVCVCVSVASGGHAKPRVCLYVCLCVSVASGGAAAADAAAAERDGQTAFRQRQTLRENQVPPGLLGQ